jgi:hypothetical protein
VLVPLSLSRAPGGVSNRKYISRHVSGGSRCTLARGGRLLGIVCAGTIRKMHETRLIKPMKIKQRGRESH